MERHCLSLDGKSFGVRNPAKLTLSMVRGKVSIRRNRFILQCERQFGGNGTFTDGTVRTFGEQTRTTCPIDTRDRVRAFRRQKDMFYKWSES